MKDEASKTDDSERYTQADMLQAFLHGREYEKNPSKGDLSSDTPIKYLGFFDWLPRRLTP